MKKLRNFVKKKLDKNFEGRHKVIRIDIKNSKCSFYEQKKPR